MEMIIISPAVIDLYDSEMPDVHLATIKCRDDRVSSVKIHSYVNPGCWPELSDAIFEALKQIHGEPT